MIIEEPPKRHILGAYPTHSPSATLHENFQGLTSEACHIILLKFGYSKDSALKPTRKALDDNIVDVCGKNLLWNLTQVENVLKSAGLKPERQPANQTFTPIDNPDMQWGNLTTIGTYFAVTGSTVGKWLLQYGLRDKDGSPHEKIVKQGYVKIGEMKNPNKRAKQKVLPVIQWNVNIIIPYLMKKGHLLNYDYETVHKGKGKNSDVSVTGVDSRVKELTERFIELYKNPETRHKVKELLEKESPFILKKMDEKLGKDGFISKKEYLKFL